MNVTVIKKDESVIYNGKIYRQGQSFEVDDLIGESLMERGYVAITVSDDAEISVNDDEGKTEDNSTIESLENASYTELKKLAARMGLSANGKKDELLARIIEAEQKKESEIADEAEVNADDLPNTDMPE